MEAFLFASSNAFLRYHQLPGDEPTWLYLAGLGLAATALYPQVISGSALARQRAIVPDWLGCGFSDRPAAFGYSISDHAETLADLLDALGTRGCTVVGHSMGGAVAITLATQRPDLVTRLILAEANLDAGGGAFSRSIATLSEQAFLSSGYQALLASEQRNGQAGKRSSAVTAGIWQTAAPYALYRSAVSLVQGVQPSWREQLYRLAIPRVYVFGEHSLPDQDYEVLPSYGVDVAIVPKAGHNMLVENPAGVAQVLLSLR
jgi:pimeloyl-ACP methyl ester carboxylesterase